MPDTDTTTTTTTTPAPLTAQSIRRKLEACGCETSTVGSYDDIGGNKIYLFRCAIDADAAEKLLESHGNPNNRKILKSNVTKLVHDMNEGRWEDNADPLVLDANLMFKNGHHRLTALAASDAKIAFNVFVGVGSDLYDVGKPRTVKDQMKMSGIDADITKKTPALMVAWYLRQGRSDKRVRFTGSFSNAEIIAGTEDLHAKVMELSELVAGPENRHLARPQVIGTLAFASVVEPDKVASFLTEMRDMENLAKGSPVLWCAKKLGSTPTTMSGTMRENLALDVLVALKAYCDGTEIAKGVSQRQRLKSYDHFFGATLATDDVEDDDGTEDEAEAAA